MTEAVKLAVIGGSGLYDMPEITDKATVSVDTPFGKPSSDIVVGTLRGKRVAFLARHGAGHILAPAAIPQRANIYALKSLGVRFIISVNAVGSLREDYVPSHLVIPDQLFDYNIGVRERSFFHKGIVAHVSVAQPFDSLLREMLVKAVQSTEGTVHDGGTFIIEDGPRFATRAESIIFKGWGCDIIGMTAAPEAFLAREAEIAYACLTHITDYDSWREEEEPVTAEMVMATIGKNVAIAKKAIAYAIEKLDEDVVTASHTVLDDALTTPRDAMPQSEIDKLAPILNRALKL